MPVTPSDLDRKYADTDDPWEFRTSPYEQAKFLATRNALSRDRYGSGLELGCGNGALARHLSVMCDRYVGLDAVERAVQSARRDVPSAQFVRGWLPYDLPHGAFDLIVLSEILYFLDPTGLRQLSREIVNRWPRAEILCVTWQGQTGHTLQGVEALHIFLSSLPPGHEAELVCANSGYRIDRYVPDGPP